MPILPLVDLLILMGTGSLMFGFGLKAIAMTTHYRLTLLGFTAMDFAVVTAVCFGLALTLVARTWLKLHEPTLLSLQSRLRAEQAHARVRELELARTGTDAPPSVASFSGDGQ